MRRFWKGRCTVATELITLDDGKYTLVHDLGNFHAMHHGAPWQDLTGNKMVYACFCEIAELRKRLSEVHSWVVCAAIASPEDLMQNAQRIIDVTAPTWPEGDHRG